MAEKEGWSKEKVFALLKDPVKLVKKMEHVRICFIKNIFCAWRKSESFYLDKI
jgi:hypothetical protein